MTKIIKDIKQSLDTIRNFMINEVAIDGVPYLPPNTKGLLEIKENEVKLNIEDVPAMSSSVYENAPLKDILIQISDKKYVTKDNFIPLKINTKIDEVRSEVSNTLNCSFNSLYDRAVNLSEKYFFRYVVPIEKCNWYNDIQNSGYSYGLNRNHAGLLVVNLKGVDLHLFPVDESGKTYLFMESLEPCTIQQMNDFYYPISLVLGLITGEAPFGSTFILTSRNGKWEQEQMVSYIKQRPTITCSTVFFTTNVYSLNIVLNANKAAYAINQIKDKNGKLIEELLDWIHIETFQKMVSALLDDPRLARASLVLLESSNATLEVQGGVASVVLETLGNIYGEKSGHYFEKKTWKDHIMPLFEQFINTNDWPDIVTDEIKQKWINKLGAFNNIPNQEKLTRPFLDLGYDLQEYDKEVLNDRNRYLHGDIKGNTFEEQFEELYYSSLELQKLCAILIFGACDYHGYLVNPATLTGRPKAIQHNEPVLVKI
jgi:hypothetical protein